ncbi:hypothetical protein NG798_12120 [Ancylothrix sp. C2]|nr:hypothetical protein [Ancylothrix sp. D3o]
MPCPIKKSLKFRDSKERKIGLKPCKLNLIKPSYSSAFICVYLRLNKTYRTLTETTADIPGTIGVS